MFASIVCNCYWEYSDLLCNSILLLFVDEEHGYTDVYLITLDVPVRTCGPFRHAIVS